MVNPIQEIIREGLRLLAPRMEPKSVVAKDDLEGLIEKTFDECHNANDVFRKFSVQAAKQKVREMYFAKSSGDRQRAQETILLYNLGKPVDRSVSINMQIANASDEELKHEIRRLLSELSIAGEPGKLDGPFVRAKTAIGHPENAVLPAESGISGELPQVDGTKPTGDGG